MFNKIKFAQIIKNIKETYNSQEEFSKKSEIGRTYLSQYMNAKLEYPPKPKILEKLALASHGITDYKELMQICGYTKKNIEAGVYSIYKNLKEYHKYINNGKSDKDNFYQIEAIIEHFQIYLELLKESLDYPPVGSILLQNIFNLSTFIEDYVYIAGFLLIYNHFIKLLENENFIQIHNYAFIDCFSIEDIYNNLNSLKKLELLSSSSENITLRPKNNIRALSDYLDTFSHSLTLVHLSEFDNNSLINIFKKKAETTPDSPNELIANAESNTNEYSVKIRTNEVISSNAEFYMCPVYGRISAGQPNWAEESIEGRIPIDPTMMNISKPEECFFLRVNGESMNKLVKNGGYALIRKQDTVEDGEIAVVLVNGYDATLKKFTRQGDFVILEPQSTVTDDPDIKTQIYDNKTSIKILGKYIGKFEMNG